MARSGALADYLIVWVDYAQEQYLSLDHDVATRLTERLRVLAADPEFEARYDAGTDRWSAQFDSGAGLIVYILSETYRRIVILRVVPTVGMQSRAAAGAGERWALMAQAVGRDGSPGGACATAPRRC